MNTKRLLVLVTFLVALALPVAPSAAGATLNFAAAVNRWHRAAPICGSERKRGRYRRPPHGRAPASAVP